jgi:hypothetical protein
MAPDLLSEFLRKESHDLQVSSDKLEAKATELSPLVEHTADELKTTHLVVAVHGVGKQYRYSTIQGVTTRFAAYCKSPITQPLGAFHPDKLILKPDSPELGAYLFQPPTGTTEFAGFGFAESFWADIPEMATATQNTTEDTKAWAQTIVERVKAMDAAGGVHSSKLIDYNKASAVVAELIDAIKVLDNLLFIATKAGLLQFNLGQLLTDFAGCVQLVADYKDYGGNIFDRFLLTMRNLRRRMPHLEGIYIIAHSEGTVVSFRGLLSAMSVLQGPDDDWIDLVKGYMTIGSPLNKHVVMWPKLWEGLKPHPERKRAEPIHWRNYYDYGDPIGYELGITRQWMGENGWLPEKQPQKNTKKPLEDTPALSPIFEFSDQHDYGFTRYPLPGEAHNDYWKDDGVFGHFIDNVIRGQKHAKAPTSIPWTVAISWFLPYVLCLGLLTAGIYILYNTLVSVFFGNTSSDIIQDVAGITSLLAGSTVLSRIPRLDKVIPGAVFGAGAFLLGAIGYWLFLGYWQSVPSTARHLLDSAFLIPSGIVLYFLGASIGSAVISKLRPTWGMAPLISLGGVAACIVLANLLSIDFSKNLPKFEQSLWALVLANAAFLYLWWLAALLFDLVYIWHRYIYYGGSRNKILNDLRKRPKIATAP